VIALPVEGCGGVIVIYKYQLRYRSTVQHPGQYKMSLPQSCHCHGTLLETHGTNSEHYTRTAFTTIPAVKMPNKSFPLVIVVIVSGMIPRYYGTKTSPRPETRRHHVVGYHESREHKHTRSDNTLSYDTKFRSDKTEAEGHPHTTYPHHHHHDSSTFLTCDEMR